MTRSLAFFDQDARKGWQRALTCAGTEGRVATMLDIVDARIATLKRWTKTPVWNAYATTTTAEYVGTSKGGNRIILVAHGVGPLATPDDFAKVYKKRDTHNDRNTTIGAISRKQFLALESGKYGPVEVIDYDSLFDRFEFVFDEAFGADRARIEPWMRARLGPRWQEFIDAHEKADAEYAEMPECKRHIRDDETAKKQPPIFALKGGENSSRYGFGAFGGHPRKTFDEFHGWLEGGALAHLLSIGQVSVMHFPEYRPRPTLHTEVTCHSSGDGTRFIAMPEGADADFKVVDSSAILKKHWRDLIVPAQGQPVRLRHLQQIGDAWFTQTLKQGDRMDSGVAEHPVKKVRKIGTGRFQTKIGGYHGFVKYGLREVEAIMPEGANAYHMDDARIVGDAEYHEIDVTFYDATIDLKHRLLRTEEIEANVDLLMKFSR